MLRMFPFRANSSDQRGASAHHGVFTTSAIVRLTLGWLALLLAPLIPHQPSTPTAFFLLAALIGVITLCSLGVVAQAEALAHRLGDPYGTLVLTLSIVIIEVILISAVLLGPGNHQEIARDSIMTVSMIIMNLVAGVGLIILSARGSRSARQDRSARHAGVEKRERNSSSSKRGPRTTTGSTANHVHAPSQPGANEQAPLAPNPVGVRAYLARIAILGALAFLLPVLIGSDGAYTPVQSTIVAGVVATFYGWFLHRQLGQRSTDFQELGSHPAQRADLRQREPLHGIWKQHRGEIVIRALVLIATAIPIVILAHNMASLLELTAQRFTLPSALPAAIIATIVFLPETITTFRAAYRGEPQRVSNLCHGALLSSFGLTIPSVLTISVLTGKAVTLAESPANLALFFATVLLTGASFRGRPRASAGAAHLLLFGLYAVVTFS